MKNYENPDSKNHENPDWHDWQGVCFQYVHGKVIVHYENGKQEVIPLEEKNSQKINKLDFPKDFSLLKLLFGVDFNDHIKKLEDLKLKPKFWIPPDCPPSKAFYHPDEDSNPDFFYDHNEIEKLKLQNDHLKMPGFNLAKQGINQLYAKLHELEVAAKKLAADPKTTTQVVNDLEKEIERSTKTPEGIREMCDNFNNCQSKKWYGRGAK